MVKILINGLEVETVGAERFVRLGSVNEIPLNASTSDFDYILPKGKKIAIQTEEGKYLLFSNDKEDITLRVPAGAAPRGNSPTDIFLFSLSKGQKIEFKDNSGNVTSIDEISTRVATEEAVVSEQNANAAELEDRQQAALGIGLGVSLYAGDITIERKITQPLDLVKARAGAKGFKWAVSKFGSSTTASAVKNFLDKELKLPKGKFGILNVSHWDYMQDFGGDMKKIFSGDIADGGIDLAKHTSQEVVETQTMKYVADPVYKKLGGEHVERFTGKALNWMGENTLGRMGSRGQNVLNAIKDIMDIKPAATNTATAATETTNATAEIKNATTAVTETTEATSATVNIASKGNWFTRSVSWIKNSDIGKFGGKIFAPLAPAMDYVSGTNLVSDANAQLANTNGMSAEKIEALRSQRGEGYTKMVIGSGALTVAAGFLLASNPVGWTVLAGAAVYSAFDWASEYFSGKSISATIGDSARWIGNKVSNVASGAWSGIKKGWNWLFGGSKKKKAEEHHEDITPDIATLSSPAINIELSYVNHTVSAPAPSPEMSKAVNAAAAGPDKSQNHYVFSKELQDVQIKGLSKLTQKEIDDIIQSVKGADISDLKDGKYGKLTEKMFVKLGISEFVNIGLDKNERIKMANEGKDDYYKALNSYKDFAEISKTAYSDVSKALDYYENGAVNKSKMAVDQYKDLVAKTPAVNVYNRSDFNVSESTSQRKPSFIPKDLVTKDPSEFPTRNS